VKRKPVLWPALLNDGGWRERRSAGQYWPQYIRRRRGLEHKVTHVPCFGPDGLSGWVLEIGSSLKGMGTLDEVLTASEVLNSKKVDPGQRLAK